MPAHRQVSEPVWAIRIHLRVELSPDAMHRTTDTAWLRREMTGPYWGKDRRATETGRFLLRDPHARAY